MNTKFETQNLPQRSGVRQNAGDSLLSGRPEMFVKYFTSLSNPIFNASAFLASSISKTSASAALFDSPPRHTKVGPGTLSQVLEISKTTQYFTPVQAFFTPSFTSKCLIFQKLRKISRFFYASHFTSGILHFSLCIVHSLPPRLCVCAFSLPTTRLDPLNPGLTHMSFFPEHGSSAGRRFAASPPQRPPLTHSLEDVEVTCLAMELNHHVC